MAKLLKYHQAKYDLLNLIAEKHLKVGDRLPSMREMDGIFRFSEICLRRALNDLEKQGFLEKRRGLGIYLTREIEAGELNGKLLYLEITPIETAVNRSAFTLKKYLRERSIALQTMTCTTPDDEILHAAGQCIGVLVSGFITREWVDFLNTLPLPVLCIGSSSFSDQLPTVSYDWKCAVHLLMKRFVERGFRRIGLINGAKEYYPSSLLAEAFLESSGTYGLNSGESDILWKPVWDARSVHDFLGGADYDALVVEPGALIHVLISSHQFHFARNAALGVIGTFDNNYSSDRITYISFGPDIFVESGRIFFESLNHPDYFHNGPHLMKPQILE